MVTPSSSTSVGGGRSPGRSAGAPRSGAGATVRQRKAAPTTRAKSTPGGGTGANSTMWRFYSEDSPGLKVGPVPVLVMSLLFIACVFILHMWGRYNKA